ncbi:hypothetical protein WI89_01010 [Burkholderia ubonensis]|uniref:DNA-methyltransferase n=1 Tax=Burkholderia ubonensis TaxID=101571 RepID=UPI00075AA522|nr:site-specific DNA-methyltransferase [Burkholderia ubonensis]KVD71833.1 hypothetical protein WI89_01010 [Burkholderia ubonensis]
MNDASVDSIVTDPPYELGFMGKCWDKSGIANNVAMWREVLRALKPGGHLLAFSGSRTYHRMACAIEDAGFELRDQIMWIYGSGFPKSKNLDAEWDGWGTALKPAHEPICVARKPLAGTVAANVLAHGTGALNIDACRVHADDALGGQYTVKRFAPGASVNADGNWKQDVDYRGEMKAGRWPANVIHDGSDEVLAAFPDAPGQQAPSSDAQRTRANCYGALSHGGKQYTPRSDPSSSAARFFYCAKASRADRNEGVGGSDTPVVATNATMRKREDADWPARNGNPHPTVKPTDLMAYLCRLVTPPGGIVLDPFMGSGSTGKAAMREGFQFISIDLMPEYVEIAKVRIAHEHERVQREAADAARQPALFETAA